MNGVDFNEEETVTMVFIGKGEGTSPMIIVMAIMLFMLLIAAIVMLVFGLQTYMAAKDTKNDIDKEEKDKITI